MASAGYASPGSQHDLMDLQVLRMNGEALELRVPSSIPGREVQRMVLEERPSKPGAKLALYHGNAKLILHQTLREQGIVDEDATLSCTLCPTDLYAAWCFVRGHAHPDEEFGLEGVTQMESLPMASLKHSNCLESFESPDRLRLPRTLQSLTFGRTFDQSLDRVSLPSSLQSLTFGDSFNQSLDRVSLPSSLQSLTFGDSFN